MASENDILTKSTDGAFTESWWQDFVHRSYDFNNACVIKNALSASFDNLWKELEHVLSIRIKNNFKDIDSFSLYVNNELQGVQGCMDFFSSVISNPEHNIIEHIRTKSQKLKFGMILNCCEQFSDDFLKLLHKLMAPLSEVAGEPVCGLDATVFIGNYGWTPLGIHQDQPGENVIHLHLGPGEKIMYVWDEDEYREIINKYFDETPANMMDREIIESLLPKAQKHHFGCGDLYYMPWNNFHIGFANELSYGITVWFNSPEEKQLAIYLLENMKQNLPKNNNKKTILPRIKKGNTKETILSHKKMMSGTPVESDFLSDNFIDFRNKISSNGGWRLFPYSRSELNEAELEDIHLSASSFRSLLPFKIIHQVNKNNDTLYLRGVRINLITHPKFPVLIESLNHPTGLPYMDIVLLLAPWPEEAVHYLLKKMYDLRAIEIVQ
ncbi:TPA: hypothetical protein JG914_004691 [Enterobacter hormaechei subsp. steigerwaltii]|nr:hypothetical protein [Enterobacter hormaechei subsp. steigerwaltii]